MLFDISEQRFTLWNLTLWPQDLTLLAWIFIVAAFALFFVTTFAGRVWCGFMCPQTTWTFIYIWFEEKIEGSRNKRIKLDERKMDTDKFVRKTLKHVAWVSVALLTSLTFVGYFTPIDALFIDFFTFSSSFWATVCVLFFAVCTYGNAAYMREIMCTHICPYARFQSAMFDKDTFTVAYDAARGEPVSYTHLYSSAASDVYKRQCAYRYAQQASIFEMVCSTSASIAVPVLMPVTA